MPLPWLGRISFSPSIVLLVFITPSPFSTLYGVQRQIHMPGMMKRWFMFFKNVVKCNTHTHTHTHTHIYIYNSLDNIFYIWIWTWISLHFWGIIQHLRKLSNFLKTKQNTDLNARSRGSSQWCNFLFYGFINTLQQMLMFFYKK